MAEPDPMVDRIIDAFSIAGANFEPPQVEGGLNIMEAIREVRSRMDEIEPLDEIRVNIADYAYIKRHLSPPDPIMEMTIGIEGPPLGSVPIIIDSDQPSRFVPHRSLPQATLGD